MRFKPLIFFGMVIGTVLVGAVRAQAQVSRYAVTINAEMAADRSIVWDQLSETTIMSASALQTLSQARLSVSGNQELEILEAYTRKLDGRVIPVEKAEIATQDGAIGAAITFLDVKIKQVPFRDVAIGDTVVVKARYTQREHYVPGHYSYFGEPAADGIEKTISFTLRAPSNVPIRHSARYYAYEEKHEGATVLRRWYATLNPAPTTENGIADYSLVGSYFSFSTFDSYEMIGRAYGEAAASKMQVTPRVQALADQITAGIVEPMAQAEAVFRWVAQNIRYVAVYFGTGRIVRTRRRLSSSKVLATARIRPF